ncbi:MAG: deoxyuridine 5'-triphosphate nucleotidohydrolase [Candidatus Faecivicinus sp.]
MNRIAQFFPVSRAQLEADWASAGMRAPVPEEIRLPRRATSGSAGYDFFAPAGFELAPGESVLLPTGVRAKMDEGWVLMLYPRSGLGFKYRLQLNNTVGVIDSDYFGAKNEGHIMLKLTNDSREGKTLRAAAGEAVAQGVFVPFGITTDDDASAEREGGFGSTNRK